MAKKGDMDREEKQSVVKKYSVKFTSTSCFGLEQKQRKIGRKKTRGWLRDTM
jgi:hypothetical protein